MSIKIGRGEIKSLYKGTTPITSVYKGSTKIWPIELDSKIQIQYTGGFRVINSPINYKLQLWAFNGGSVDIYDDSGIATEYYCGSSIDWAQLYTVMEGYVGPAGSVEITTPVFETTYSQMFEGNTSYNPNGVLLGLTGFALSGDDLFSGQIIVNGKQFQWPSGIPTTNGGFPTLSKQYLIGTGEGDPTSLNNEFPCCLCFFIQPKEDIIEPDIYWQTMTQINLIELYEYNVELPVITCKKGQDLNIIFYIDSDTSLAQLAQY